MSKYLKLLEWISIIALAFIINVQTPCIAQAEEDAPALKKKIQKIIEPASEISDPYEFVEVAPPGSPQPGQKFEKVPTEPGSFPDNFYLIDRTPYYTEVDPSTFSHIYMKFDQDLNWSTITNAITLERHHPGPTKTIAGTAGLYAYIQNNMSVIDPKAFLFTPNSELETGAIYRVRLKGGFAGVRSKNGNKLKEDLVWNFYTEGETQYPAQGACPVGEKCFGTLCQDSFENNWQVTAQGLSIQLCAYFTSAMGPVNFHIDLNNAENYFSTDDGNPSGGLDSVHLAFIDTHGGADFNDACISMYNQDVTACTNEDNWRLGDNSTQLGILALHACNALTMDNHTIDRWQNTFRGGLIMALGSHGIIWLDEANIEKGELFAEYLHDGKKVKWAWIDAMTDDSFDEDVAVMASGSIYSGGSAQTNCAYRRDNLKWQYLHYFPYWKDSEVNYICWSYITD